MADDNMSEYYTKRREYTKCTLCNDGVVLPCKCLFNKCQSFAVKTYREVNKPLGVAEFCIYNIDVTTRYPGMQNIFKEVSGDNENVITYKVMCKDFNTSLIELYTFRCDAYLQVTNQLIVTKSIPWKIQLKTEVDIEDGRSPRMMPLTSAAVHFDDKSEIIPYYIETFKIWEHDIVALVDLRYRVLYLDINVIWKINLTRYKI